ncbi:MAG: GIY-YIG nuclease family protein [Candidatus Bathyarchaeia archaeon]
MPYYVYILLCEDGSYYTGYARDIGYRFKQHEKGRGARYTRSRKPEEIVYIEEYNSRSEAMKREREIKSLTHEQKQRLINDNSKTR